MFKKKFISSVLAITLAGSSIVGLTACNGLLTQEGPEIDKTKTTLQIFNAEGGMGDEWLNAVGEKFAEAYSDYQGEDGKVGVQVVVTNKTSELGTGKLSADMPYNDADVYFLENADYLTLQMVQHKGKSILADLTDIVTDKIYDANGSLAPEGQGTVSIEDKMVNEFATYYNLGTKDAPAYYGLPYFSTPAGGIYDADCFNENKLYYKANGTIGANQADIDAGNCGKGPDGELGTYDDGMPATWEEFVDLMDAMVRRDLIPWMWGGANTYQRLYFVRNIYANYEGKNDYDLLFTLSGTDSEFGNITPGNGYLLGSQEGKLAVVKVIHDIMSTADYYSSDAMSANTTHTNAQMYFVKSIQQGKRIAMFMEGGWWENEAREHFDSMAMTPGWGFGERDFRLLPIPNFEGTTLLTAEENKGVARISTQKDNRQVLTMTDSGGAAFVVSAQAPQLELAKEFVKFIHSREMLVLMTQVSATFRPFEYTFTPEEKAGCTKFAQSIIKMMEDENTDICYQKAPRSSIVSQNASYFTDDWYGGFPFNAFYNTGASVLNVYSGYKKFTENNWPR